MHFLIDYENVKNMRMRGTEYLIPTAPIIVFFSADAPTMEQRHLDNIHNSGCGFEVCKLLRQRKNGLDFYIATKARELFGASCCKAMALASGDSGFQAVREFWQERSGTKNRVALSENIEHGIIASGEVGECACMIRACRKMVDIGNFHAAYQKNLTPANFAARVCGHGIYRQAERDRGHPEQREIPQGDLTEHAAVLRAHKRAGNLSDSENLYEFLRQ